MATSCSEANNHIVYSTESSGDAQKDDYKKLCSNQNFIECYVNAKAQHPDTSISNALQLLFFSTDCLQANHFISKINACFIDSMHFKLTPVNEKSPVHYVITLFFEPEKELGKQLESIQFTHRKSPVQFPTPVELPFHFGGCPSNTGIQFVCYHLMHGAQIQELMNYMPPFQSHLLVTDAAYDAFKKCHPNTAITKGAFKNELENLITKLATKISSEQLIKLKRDDYTCTFDYKHCSYAFTIPKENFVAYTKLILRLENLCVKLIKGTDNNEAKKAYYNFVNVLFPTIKKQDVGSLFLILEQRDKTPAPLKINSQCSPMDIIAELFKQFSLGCSKEFDANVYQITANGSRSTIYGGATFPTLNGIEAVDNQGVLNSYSYENWIAQQFKKSVPLNSYNEIVYRIVCKSPPNQMIIDVEPLPITNDMLPKEVDISKISLTSPCNVGIVALLNLVINDGLKIKIPICHDITKPAETKEVTYKVIQVICNNGGHFSLLRFTDNHKIYHIDDNQIADFTLTTNEGGKTITGSKLKEFSSYVKHKNLKPFALSLLLCR